MWCCHINRMGSSSHKKLLLELIANFYLCSGVYFAITNKGRSVLLLKAAADSYFLTYSVSKESLFRCSSIKFFVCIRNYPKHTKDELHQWIVKRPPGEQTFHRASHLLWSHSCLYVAALHTPQRHRGPATPSGDRALRRQWLRHVTQLCFYYSDPEPGPGDRREEGSEWRTGNGPAGPADASPGVRGPSAATGHGGERTSVRRCVLHSVCLHESVEI